MPVLMSGTVYPGRAGVDSTLFAYTIPANYFATDGTTFSATINGNKNWSRTLKTVRVYAGLQTLPATDAPPQGGIVIADAVDLTLGGAGPWTMTFSLPRQVGQSANTLFAQHLSTVVNGAGGATVPSQTINANWSAPLNLVVTGFCTGSARDLNMTSVVA